MRRLPLVLVAAAIGLIAAGTLDAGQVRVDVGPDTQFHPSTVTANPGDYIVWVWLGGGHTVTSGTDGSLAGDGKFATQILSAGDAFSWKSQATAGSVPYYCSPHFAVGMTGTISLAPATPAANFRITEVLYNDATQHDQIEITNFGNATGDFGRYRFRTPIDTAIVREDHFLVPAGGRVKVWVNQAGTTSAPTDLFMPTLLDLPDVQGSLSLLVPNTNPGTSSFGSIDQLIDFVEWGAPFMVNEAVAVAAGIWNTGEYKNTIQFGHSLEFCGTPSQYGATYWNEVAVPNFGVDGQCSTTPTLKTTWGRIKAIYR
jgi:plastocyanin